MATLPEPLIVSDVCAAVLHQMDPVLRQRKQHVTIDGAPSIHITFDRAQLCDVLTRILANASDFSSHESVIRLSVVEHARSVSVTVSDTGCGIPKADLPHITEKYIRASNAGHVQPNGNGLSLYIVRGILERAGGSLQIESEEGKGTTVTITLPR